MSALRRTISAPFVMDPVTGQVVRQMTLEEITEAMENTNLREYPPRLHVNVPANHLNIGEPVPIPTPREEVKVPEEEKEDPEEKEEEKEGEFAHWPEPSQDPESVGWERTELTPLADAVDPSPRRPSLSGRADGVVQEWSIHRNGNIAPVNEVHDIVMDFYRVNQRLPSMADLEEVFPLNH